MNPCSFTHPAAALAALLLSLLSSGCGRSPEAAPKGPMAADVQQSLPPIIVVMETDKGTMEIELMPSVAPKTVENFRLLTERGYYNGVTFHRIVKGFMIQGGDPKGDGRGGESAWGGTFEDEIDKTSGLYRDGYKRGSVAMANSGPNTNTSQFFIVHQDYPLHPGYTIFGKVIKGIEVVDALANTPTTAGPMTSEKSKPVTPPVMKKVWIKK